MGPTPNPRARRLVRAAGVGATGALVLGALAGCATDNTSEPGFMGIPAPATDQGHTIFTFWNNSWVAALAVGVLTWTLILFAAIAYRRRRGDAHLPTQLRYNLPIEILYTVAPAIMIAVMFLFTARDQSELIKLTPDPANVVNVIGFKWNWTFNYVNDDAHDSGTADVHAELWLPVNERTRFELTSADVIHSFWVPAFLFKMDVVPGRKNQFELTPDKIGTYAGRCAELCGVDHSRMLFTVHVVSKADYDAHIAAIKNNGGAGLVDTGRVVTTGVAK